MEGFLFIDKPAGPTSHDIVDQIRKLTGIKKVGHAGTLDPFATGLLILALGNTTKKIQALVGLDKEYEALVQLGATSDTYDRTGRITEGSKIKYKVAKEDIEDVLKKFRGKIEQIPPMYSAKKVKGKKLYELARKGIEIVRQPSQITIHKLEIENFDPELKTLTLRVQCSSGTYVRSLAYDIGQELGCGAYLKELRRTSIGPFRIEDAAQLEPLSKDNVAEHLHLTDKTLGAIETISKTSK